MLVILVNAEIEFNANVNYETGLNDLKIERIKIEPAK